MGSLVDLDSRCGKVYVVEGRSAEPQMG